MMILEMVCFAPHPLKILKNVWVIAKHIPKTCVKEINVLSYRYFNAENKKHLIMGTTNKPHLAMKLVSPMQ